MQKKPMSEPRSLKQLESRSSRSLSEADARMMVRLVAEATVFGKTIAEKQTRLLSELSELVDAKAWLWNFNFKMISGIQKVYVSYAHGGFSLARFAKYLQALEHPDMGRVADAIFREVEVTDRPVTMPKYQIDPDNRASESEALKLRVNADIGHLVVSFHPTDDHFAGCVGLYRRVSEPPFTDREVQMIHIVLTEVPWLHRTRSPDDRGAKVPRLSPRQQSVLVLLLDGHPRKVISQKLGISEHTLGGYIKEVFRHFSVNSQAELMHRFLSGQVSSFVT
jgi:DNA-binding CsgD family transcriptional regulator